MASIQEFEPPKRIRPIGGPGAIQINDGTNQFTGSQSLTFSTDKMFIDGDVTTGALITTFNTDPSNNFFLDGQLIGLGGGGLALEQLTKIPNVQDSRGAGIQLTPNITRLQSKGRIVQFVGNTTLIPDTNSNGDGCMINSSAGDPFGDYKVDIEGDITIQSGNGNGNGNFSGDINIIQPEPEDTATSNQILISGTNALYIQNGNRQYELPTSLPVAGQFLNIATLGNPIVNLQFS